MISVLLIVMMANPKPDPSEEFFKPTAAVITIRIEVDKENLARLQNEPRKHVRCTLKVGDESYAEVGIHLKGQAGSFRDWNDKPALTLNMDKFKKGQSFRGMDKYHLNNSVQDDTYLHEILTGYMFRSTGTPAPRGTHVMVELNGRKVGLYLLKEGFDKPFLKRYFEKTNGRLYDGGFLTDIDQNLELDRGTSVDGKDLKDLAAALRGEDKAARMSKVEKLLDVEKFLGHWAVEVLGCDWDGYTRNRNNYRLYNDPATGKFVMFAHGKDQMFQNTSDSLVPGFGGLIARRIYETDDGKKRYHAKLSEVFDREFKLDDLNKRIDDYANKLRDHLNATRKGWGDEYMNNQVKQLRNRLKARVDYVTKELPKLK
jgi:spore coat protein H